MTGVSAVALNVTAVHPDDKGTLSIWTEGTTQPGSPNLAVAGAGDAVGKLVIVPPSAEGKVVLNATTGMDVLIDVVGWFAPAPGGANAGRYERGTGTRVADSSTSLGTPGALPADGQIEIAIAGSGGVPKDASAVALKVDLFEAVPTGFVTLWSTGTLQPAVSQLQVPSAGYTASNIVVVAPGDAGKVSLHTSAATGLTIDVVGWFTGASAPKASEGLFVALPKPLQLDAGTIEPPYRHDVTLRTAGGLPTQSGAAAFAEIIEADAADAGSVSVHATRTARSPADDVPVQGIGTTTISPMLVPVGEGDRLSIAAEQSVKVTVTVLGYVIGRPVVPDPAYPPDPATAQGTPAIASFDQIIEQLIAGTGSSGASVAVAQDGRIVYARAYGQRDIDTGDPTRVDSRYRFASMTKVFTAATLLQIVQAGGVGLDDAVFPILAARVPLPAGHDPRLETITVRQLLSHTSGLRNSPDVFFNEEPGVADAFGPGGPTSCESAAQWFVQFPLKQDPGTHFDYVNMNFCLAGLIIETLTGESYASAVTHLVLQRRGIKDVVVGRSHRFGPTDVTHRTPGVNEPGGGNFMESLGGAGNLIGTPIDLVRFLDGLDPKKPGEHLLTPEFYKQFTTVQPGQGGWGLGAEVFGGDSFGHSGSLDGARGAMVHREDGLTYAITVNGTFKAHSSTLRDAVARALATVPTWPTWNYNDELP